MILHDHLKSWFGFNTFRPYQEDVIQAVLAGHDVLTVLPTGSGKSLCYQLPAVMSEGTAIIVSPLISLMEDQVQQLVKNGIQATYVNSSLGIREKIDILDQLDTFKCVYVSPERLLEPDFLDRLKRIKLSFFVIDEAHCISQWGHSFRTEYRQLSSIKLTFPEQPIMALTATATKDVQNDIVRSLDLVNPQIIIGSFERENLQLKVTPKQKAKEVLLDFVAQKKDRSGIIYCSTRKQVDSVYDLLHEKKYSVAKYHAGLSDYDRSQALHQFINDDVFIMVATVAFGMGINKPDVRYVFHYNMPKTIEQYYQEIGRAGRDGLAAECILLFSTADAVLYKRMLSDQIDDTVKLQMSRKIEQMVSYCHTATCRVKEILAYFGEDYTKQACNQCDTCLNECDTIDGTIIAQKILSCVFRLHQRFGIHYVVDVLMGSKNKKVLSNRHDRLSTYGLLADYSKKQIHAFIFSS